MKGTDRPGLLGHVVYGSSVVGERGQVVIPKKARTALGIKPGTSVLFVGSRTAGLLLIVRSDVLGQLLGHIVRRLERLTTRKKGL